MTGRAQSRPLGSSAVTEDEEPPEDAWRDRRPGANRRAEAGVAPGVHPSHRAVLRGAATGLVIGALAIAGIVVADRIGDDPSSTPSSVGTVTTVAIDAPGTPPSAAPVATPSPTITVATTSPAADGAAPTLPAPTLPATTAPVTPTAPAGTGSTSTAPAVDAAAYAVLDVTSGRWLAELSADEPRPVGSVMKLLTSYVVMQAGDPDKVVTVPALELDPEESSIGLYEGEQLSRSILLRAMLIVSANDAARSLAIDIGGSTDGFVSMMNGAASALGLSATVAANPIGLDAEGAHSSARDMASLAALLMQDPTFRATVARPSASLHGQTFPATNADFLGSYAGADGVKTGHTTQAGYCLAASATRDGRELIVVVLGSTTEDARVAAASALLDWGFAQA